MILCIKKRTLISILLLVVMVSLVITGACLIDGAVNTSVGQKKLPIYSVEKGQDKTVALTFDAAWGADKTQGIIDILTTNNIKATFFLVGFWVDKYPDMVKKIDEVGFEIGNHSHNHLKMSTLSEDSIRNEINYVSKNVEELTGKKCKVFRAPFGDYNDNLIGTINNMGIKPIQWDVDSLDWKGISAKEITNRVCSKAKSGSIVLFHNNSDHILEALPVVIKSLKDDGYKFTTVSELVHQDNYYIDNNGRQHKKTN